MTDIFCKTVAWLCVLFLSAEPSGSSCCSVAGSLFAQMAKDFHCCFSCEGILEHCTALDIFCMSISCILLWLYSYILSTEFIVVIFQFVFYCQVVTDILHLHGQKLTAYKGDYDTFERTREEQIKNQQKAFDSSEKARAHMQVPYTKIMLWHHYMSCRWYLLVWTLFLKLLLA